MNNIKGSVKRQSFCILFILIMKESKLIPIGISNISREQLSALYKALGESDIEIDKTQIVEHVRVSNSKESFSVYQGTKKRIDIIREVCTINYEYQIDIVLWLCSQMQIF